ncbi:MAG: DUF3144 domain-containing protein [Gammaproteobacteria bacterium]|nr:DUF3144 domain-containing protein [Gammaproteobacteria bacterium]
MNDNTKDKAFLDLADTFIALANQHCTEEDLGRVSAAFLYAAARFNTYVVASSAPDAKEFASYQSRAMIYLQSEYQKMLTEHFADYAEHFNAYLNRTSKGKTLN